MSFSKSEPAEAEGDEAIDLAIPDIERLLGILSHMRPHEDAVEELCLTKYVRPYIAKYNGEETEGGIIIDVKYPNGGQSDTLFSCHTDTVHIAGGMQEVVYDTNMGMAYKSDNEPLGADDGAGMWILLNMIDAGIPGCYVFHRGEECGGVGSTWLARHRPEFFKGFKRAVAFDRKDVDSIITYQRGGRCCSDEFAEALAAEFNDVNENFAYRPDSTGLFTDTANYTHLIAECTNVSVGYMWEHTKDEYLDVGHLSDLRWAVMSVEWDTLPTHRKPEERRYYTGFHSPTLWQDEDYRGFGVYSKGASKSTAPPVPKKAASLTVVQGGKLTSAPRALGAHHKPKAANQMIDMQKRIAGIFDWVQLSYWDLMEAVEENPELAADILFAYFHEVGVPTGKEYKDAISEDALDQETTSLDEVVGDIPALYQQEDFDRDY
jgi:hypothetical protein